MNDSVSPVSSIKHKPKDRGRYSSLDVHELSVDGIKQELDEKTRLSRFNLNFGSNMSELEDEHNDTFATTDRLQSIFTMQKKKSDLHEKVKGGVQIIRRGLLSKGKSLIVLSLAILASRCSGCKVLIYNNKAHYSLGRDL